MAVSPVLRTVGTEAAVAFLVGLTCAHAAVRCTAFIRAHLRAASARPESLWGRTPLVELRSLSRETGCRVLAKLELLNPGGSVKDRVAWRAVLDAEKSGKIPRGGTIVEGTSGSTGISLAAVARSRGYRCKLLVPDDIGPDKMRLLQALGADVDVVKSASIVNEAHYVNRARALADETLGAFFVDQFENLSNFLAHYETTGPEIWDQCRGHVDAFVMSAGTGGTIAGVSRYLKERSPDTRIVLADPPGSSLYHRVRHGVTYASEQAERTVRRHRYDTMVEGVGTDRLTANFARAVIDDAVRVEDAEAVHMAHRLLQCESLFVGSSSAMNCVAALRVAHALGPGHTIVTIICDGGQRYTSHNMYRVDPTYLPGKPSAKKHPAAAASDHNVALLGCRDSCAA